MSGSAISDKMIKLDKRLSACASLVEEGSFAADVGTDHAYIPIWLIQNNVCPRCVASDVNAGPVASAKKNIEANGIAERVTVICANGLEDSAFDGCGNIIVAGMGGELIADILDGTDRPKSASRLILQPMTKQEVLRRYLWDNGYEIIYDEPVQADRLYQLFAARYTGEITEYTELETQIGKHENISECTASLVRLRIAALEKSARGLEMSGGDPSKVRKLIKELEDLL